MGEHVNRALNAPGRAIAPVAFVKTCALSKTFRKGRQEDAHEFARCLLDAMHKRCVEAARPKPRGIPSKRDHVRVAGVRRSPAQPRLV